jgi:hypothetical protein
MTERIFRDVQKGHHVSAVEWNERSRELNKLRTIQGAKGSGIVVEHRAGGIIIKNTNASLAYTLVVCTGVDEPEDGLHEFSEIDLNGDVLSGGKVFTSCRLLGDWTQGTWLPVLAGLSSGETPTYGEAFVLNGVNVVKVLGSYYME